MAHCQFVVGQETFLQVHALQVKTSDELGFHDVVTETSEVTAQTRGDQIVEIPAHVFAGQLTSREERDAFDGHVDTVGREMVVKPLLQTVGRYVARTDAERVENVSRRLADEIQ